MKRWLLILPLLSFLTAIEQKNTTAHIWDRYVKGLDKTLIKVTYNDNWCIPGDGYCSYQISNLFISPPDEIALDSIDNYVEAGLLIPDNPGAIYLLE